MEKKVNKIIAEVFNRNHHRILPLRESKILPNLSLHFDLELDSLDIMEIVVLCEHELGTKASHMEIRKIRTVGDVYNVFAGDEK